MDTARGVDRQITTRSLGRISDASTRIRKAHVKLNRPYRLHLRIGRGHRLVQLRQQKQQAGASAGTATGSKSSTDRRGRAVCHDAHRRARHGGSESARRSSRAFASAGLMPAMVPGAASGSAAESRRLQHHPAPGTRRFLGSVSPAERCQGRPLACHRRQATGRGGNGSRLRREKGHVHPRRAARGRAAEAGGQAQTRPRQVRRPDLNLNAQTLDANRDRG